MVTVTSTLVNIVSYIKNVKNLYVVFSADLDSIIASSIIMRIAREEDVETYLAPFYEATRPSDASSSILLVKVLQRTPVGGLKITQLDDLVGKDPKIISSTSMHLLRELKKHIVVPRYIDVLSLVAMLSLARGSIYDQNVIEVHKKLLSEAVDNSLFTFIDTLRLFGYPRRDVIDALIKTVDPYILGVSLNREGSKKVLEDIGGSVSSEEAKTKLVDQLASILSSYCKSCEPITGTKIILRDLTPVDDVYEATYALYCYMDALGLDPLVYVSISSKIIDIARGVFDYMSKPLRELVDYVIENGGAKRVISRGVKMGIVDISTLQTTPPLFVAHRVLRALGLTEDVTVFSNGKEYLLPAPLIAPRWPYDKELNIEKSFVVFRSLQDVGEAFR